MIVRPGAQEIADSMSKRKVVLLDFDGTLGDTCAALSAQAYTAMRAHGWDDERIGDPSRVVGPPWPGGFADIYGISLEEAQQIADLSRSMRTEENDLAFDLFEGAVEFMERLSAAGKTKVVVTSRNTGHITHALKAKGLFEYMDLVQGQDDPTQPGKVTLVGGVLERLGVTAEDAVAIGDRRYDVEMGHAWGVPCIGVLWGIGGEPELEEAGCDVMVESFEELEALLGI